jgi:hypothetical protein
MQQPACCADIAMCRRAVLHVAAAPTCGGGSSRVGGLSTTGSLHSNHQQEQSRRTKHRFSTVHSSSHMQRAACYEASLRVALSHLNPLPVKCVGCISAACSYPPRHAAAPYAARSHHHSCFCLGSAVALSLRGPHPIPQTLPVHPSTHRSARPGWSCCGCCRPDLRRVYPRAPGSCETLPLCGRDGWCWPSRRGSCSSLQQLPDRCGCCYCGGFDCR